MTDYVLITTTQGEGWGFSGYQKPLRRWVWFAAGFLLGFLLGFYTCQAVAAEPYELEVGLWTCPRGYYIQQNKCHVIGQSVIEAFVLSPVEPGADGRWWYHQEYGRYGRHDGYHGDRGRR